MSRLCISRDEGNCFDKQHRNACFAMMKTLIDLTRFTTFPFLLFVAGMHRVYDYGRRRSIL